MAQSNPRESDALLDTRESGGAHWSGIPLSAPLPESDEEVGSGGGSCRSASSKISWRGEKNDFITSLLKGYGSKFLIMLFVAQHLNKGFVQNFLQRGLQFVLKQGYGVEAKAMSVYSGCVALPWALKPAIGFLSDFAPIYGYSKSPYIVIVTFIALAALTTLSVHKTDLPVQVVVLLLFCVEVHISTVDLLTEARYTRAIREVPKSGPALASFVWGGLTAMGACASLLAGFLLSNYTPWLLYAVAILPVALMLVPTGLNYLGERPMEEAALAAHRETIAEQPELIVLVFAMICATFMLLTAGLLDTSEVTRAVVSFVVLVVILGLFSVVLNPLIAKVNAFCMVQAALWVGTGSANFYFCLDDEQTFRGGPHFSVYFYATVLPLVGGLCTLLGIWAYMQISSNWKYPYVILVANIFYFFVSLSDAVFFARLNVAMGIPDHLFALSSGGLESAINTWLLMPFVVILSQMCPRGMEAIMFSLLAGSQNLGSVISKNFTALLLVLFDVRPRGNDHGDETDTFRNLWAVSLVGSLLPMLVCVLIPFTIPNKRQQEPITDPGQPATHNSLWRKWFHGVDPLPETVPDPRTPFARGHPMLA